MYVIDKDVKEHQFQYRPMGNIACDHLDIGLLTLTLCLQLSNHSIYQIVQPSNLYLSNLEIRICCGTIMSQALHKSR